MLIARGRLRTLTLLEAIFEDIEHVPDVAVDSILAAPASVHTTNQATRPTVEHATGKQ